MDVKEAVHAAKSFVADLLSDENPSDLGLEEVDFDDNQGVWNVTVGFSRPWNKNMNVIMQLGGSPAARAYRVVRVRDIDGKFLGIKKREGLD